MVTIDEIGTLAWSRRTGGKLSRDEREAMLKQIVEAQANATPSDQLSGINATDAGLARMDIEKVRVPDSATARHAESLIAELCPSALANHCYRTYLWGSLLAQHDAQNVDEELFYVASLLHDLGLTQEHFCRNPAMHCFAVEGALAADRFLEREGWKQEKRDVVAEAITLHLNMLVDLSHGSVAHYLSAGAACDVVGTRAPELPRPAVKEVLNRHPGLGFGEEFAQLLGAEAQARPEGRIGFVVANLPPLEMFPLGKENA